MKCNHPTCGDECRRPKKPGIKKMSAKRAKQNTVYLQKRNAFLNLYPICQCCNSKSSTELHHKKGRSNDLLTDERYFFAICSPCHRKATDDSVWAIQNGFSEYRLIDHGPLTDIHSSYPNSEI